MSAALPVGSSATGYSSSASLHRSIVLRTGERGLGGFATGPIHEGEEVARVPYEWALSETYAAGTAVGRAVAPLARAHPVEVIGRVVLYLVVLAERADPSARFHAYLASLPRDYDDAVCWGEEERDALLRGTNLLEGARYRTAWLARIHSVLFPALTIAHPTLFPAEAFSLPAFCWAHSAFASRCFPHELSVPPASGEDPRAPVHVPPSAEPGRDTNPLGYADGTPVGCMLPIVDVLNHAPRTPIAWVREAGAVVFTLTPPSGGAGGVDGRAPAVAVQAGGEVCNNYGPKSNEELVLGYGFALPDNADDTLSIVIRWAEGDASAPHLNAARRDMVRACGLSTRHVLTRRGLPSSFLLALRLNAALMSDECVAGMHADGQGGTADVAASLSRLSPQLQRHLQFSIAVETARAAEHIRRMRDRLWAAHPWLFGEAGGLQPQASGCGEGSRAAYRRHIARLYVQGQADILQVADRQIRAAADEAADAPAPRPGVWVSSGSLVSLPHRSVPLPTPAVGYSLDGVPCCGDAPLCHAPLALRVLSRGRVEALVLLVEEAGAGPGSPIPRLPVLTLPAASCLSPSTLPSHLPSLATLMEATPGLELTTQGEEDSALPRQLLQLSLALLALWLRAGLGEIGGEAPEPPAKRARETDGGAAAATDQGWAIALWSKAKGRFWARGTSVQRNDWDGRAMQMASDAVTSLLLAKDSVWRRELLPPSLFKRAAAARHESALEHMLACALLAVLATSVPLPALAPTGHAPTCELVLVPVEVPWPVWRGSDPGGAEGLCGEPNARWALDREEGVVQLRVALPGGMPARAAADGPTAAVLALPVRVAADFPSAQAASAVAREGRSARPGGWLAELGDLLPDGEAEAEGSSEGLEEWLAG